MAQGCELGVLDLGGGAWGRYLRMHNPSVPELWHVEGVAWECQTVEQALRWRQPKWMRALQVSENGSDWYQQGDVVLVSENAKSIKPFPRILT